MTFRTLFRIAVAAVFVAVFGAIPAGVAPVEPSKANAQTPPPRPPAAPAGPATPARRPEKGKVFGDWGIECEVQADRSELCFIQQTHTAKESNQQILSISFGYIGPRNAPLIVVYTPLGIDVASGAAIKIDAAAQMPMRVQTCVPNGCRAVVQLNDQQVAQLRAAKAIIVGIVPWGQTETTSIGISTNGLAPALAALR